MIRSITRVSSSLSMAIVLVGTLLIPCARGESVPPAATAPFLINPPVPTPAAIVQFKGEVDDYHRDSFERRFEEAKRAGAKTIIVEIESWGGLVTSGLDLSGYLKRQHDVHTIAYIGDKAISAGAMMAVACDEIVMGNSAEIGDCAPISIGNDGRLQPLPPAERAKFQSPIIRDFEDSAARNHHDVLLMRAMVDTDVVVYWVEKEGKRSFVDEAGKTEKLKEGWKLVADVSQPVDSATTLLTVHTQLALKLGIATEEASSAEALAAKRNLSVLMVSRPDSGEAIVEWLNGSSAKTMLIVILGICLYIVMHAPGHGAAEAIGVVALGALLGVPLLTGYGQWWHILLILGGLGFIAFEIFVFPHSGAMVIIGALMMVVGLVLTFVGREPGGMPGLLPSLPQTWEAIQRGLISVVVGLIGALIASAWIGRYLPKLPIFGRLVLQESNTGTAPAMTTTVAIDPTTAMIVWPMVGTVGRAVTPLRPGGTAEFHDQRFADTRMTSVVCDAGFVDAGTPVVVREVSGARIVVRALTV